MGRQPLMINHVDREKTRRAVEEAIEEVQHVVRPRTRRLSLRAGFTWLVALATGASVVWRSFQAAQETDTREGGTAPARLPAADRSPVGTAQPDKYRPSTSGAEVNPPEATAAQATTTPDTEAKPAKVEGIVGLGKELIARFTNDGGTTQASALAFVGILSLVPLLLFVLAAIGFIIRDPNQAVDDVQRLMGQLLPGHEATQAANQLIQQTHLVESVQTLMKGKWWAVGMGILSLLWTAISLFVTASGPMNAAWEVKETRGFVRLRLICLGVFIASGLLFALSLIPSSGPDFVQHLHLPWLGLPKHPPLPIAALFQTLFFVLAVLIDTAMFAVIYRYLPNTKVSWKAALFGAFVTGFLWELFKKGFSVYLANFGNFNKLYGALGGIFLLVTWIYYSCIILLIGAILCNMYHEHKEEGGVNRKAT